MKQDKFNAVLSTAMQWDKVSDESMKYPNFDTEQELELFENFLILLNDYELLDTLGFIGSYKYKESKL